MADPFDDPAGNADAPTQQLRRPEAGRPGPGGSEPGGPDRTEVLSIQELMDVASVPAPDPYPVESAPAPAPASAPVRAPAAARAPAGPTAPPPPGGWDRLRADGAAAWSLARRESVAWLRVGDNALIAATALVALLLLVVLLAVR